MRYSKSNCTVTQWLFHGEILKNKENKLSCCAATRVLLPRETAYGRAEPRLFLLIQTFITTKAAKPEMSILVSTQ